MLEPEGNNNFFVKNERIGGGGGRAEVAEDIKVRGAPSVGSPGLCISQMCCCKGQPVKRNKHTVLSCPMCLLGNRLMEHMWVLWG